MNLEEGLNQYVIDKHYCMDCLKGMRKYIPPNVVDCLTTDPPYGIEFMDKDWDKAVVSVDVWKECFRVMKAGAFGFIMSIPRFDVMTEMGNNLIEAGFLIAFSPIFWTYASGFPKGTSMSNILDKRECIKQLKEKLRRKPTRKEIKESWKEFKLSSLNDEPITPEAKKFYGAYGGFQPKPAVEAILVVMKPLSETSYANQALYNGKGVTWFLETLMPYRDEIDKKSAIWGKDAKTNVYGWSEGKEIGINDNRLASEEGRKPANLLVSDDVLNDGEDHRGGVAKYYPTKFFGTNKTNYDIDRKGKWKDDGGGSFSRYFDLDYWWVDKIKQLPVSVQKTFPFLIVPKTTRSEKERGLSKRKLKPKKVTDGRKTPIDNPFQRGEILRLNTHPTVKPIKLMNYIIYLGSRKGDLVMDPFAGTFTTFISCRLTGRHFVGFENKKEYYKIGTLRLASYPKSLEKFWS